MDDPSQTQTLLNFCCCFCVVLVPCSHKLASKEEVGDAKVEVVYKDQNRAVEDREVLVVVVVEGQVEGGGCGDVVVVEVEGRIQGVAVEDHASVVVGDYDVSVVAEAVEEPAAPLPD